MLAFTVGSLVVHQLPELFEWWPLVLVAFALLLIAMGFKPRSLFRSIILALVCFLLGFSLTTLVAKHRLAQQLPLTDHGRVVELEGIIDSVVVAKRGYARFVLMTPKRVRLGWYFKEAETLPKAGEKWRITAKLFTPRGFSNPGGLDYERWLFQENMTATGYVKGAATRLQTASDLSVNAFRQQLVEQIKLQLDDTSVSTTAMAITAALAVGERGYLSDRDWQLLSATGTSHLVAISGLHIGLVASFFMLLGKWLGRRILPYSPTLRLPVVAALSAVFGAVLYAALAGWSIPTQRALLMVVVYALAVIFRRSRPALFAISIALLLVVLLDPLATLSKGLWLSFGAVAIIIYATEGRMQRQPLLLKIIYVQCMLSLVLAPLLMLFFGNLSVVSPLANFLLIPIYSLLVVPLVLLGIVTQLVGLGVEVWTWATVLIDYSLLLLSWLDSFSWSAFNVAAPSVAATACLILGLGLLTSPLARRLRLFGLFGLVPVLVEQHVEPLVYGELELTVLDVGQGLAAVVRTQNHILLYDTGPKFRSGTDTGAIVVLPFLQRMGVHQLDAVVLSHDDLDHTGGFQSLAAKLEITRRYTSFSGPKENCHHATSWRWDGVQFEFLNAGAASSDNNLSCILRVSSSSRSVLLPGDIEQKQEQRLLNQLKPVDVLIMPHHGSRSSSSVEFVKHTAANVAIASAGYKNRYGFPHPNVLARYHEQGTQVLNTALDGAVRIKMTKGKSLEIFRWRPDEHRYWNRYPLLDN